MHEVRAINAISAADTAAPNSILSNVQLSLRATYYPLGFPVEVASNSASILAAAEQSWRHFRPRFTHPPLIIELGVNDDAAAEEELPPAPVCRVREHLLTNIADGQNFINCDLKNGYSFGWVTRSVAENPLYTRFHFL